MKRNLIFLLVGAGFLFVSCLGGGRPAPTDSSRTSRIVSLPLVGTHWYLHEMDGQMREMLGADSAAFTLVLSDTTNLVAGSGACNRFFGEIQPRFGLIVVPDSRTHADVLSGSRCRRPLSANARQRKIVLHLCGYTPPVRLPKFGIGGLYWTIMRTYSQGKRDCSTE